MRTNENNSINCCTIWPLKVLTLLAKEHDTMDLEKTVQELRTRISQLRTQLELNNTTDDEPETTTSVREEPKQSAADVYKARLMGKKPS